ncbi:MAG: DUF547 domain-containing protein [Chitinophagaceae bacterium]|nr:MAG: DUF547 domain-containing protein [Chitinophagaceae bacterium]
MKLLTFIIVLLLGIHLNYIQKEKPVDDSVNNELIELSEKLLLQVKMEEPTSTIEKRLNDISFESLRIGLPSDKAKLTFWINIYNAYFQILAIQKNLEKPAIFTKKVIPIANHFFSLDEIEHGILRKYRWKYGLGYLPDPFPGKKIRHLAVEKTDYRLHFALNCGATSCPPIAFYNYEDIDAQLRLATESFLETDTKIHEEEKVVYVSKLFLWFRADFGGRSGINRILSKQFNIDFSKYKLKYNDYNWDTQLQNFND